MNFMEIFLPNLEFLKFGNICSGSFDDFNYKIVPRVDDSRFESYVWIGCNCLDFSLNYAEKAEFELSEKGLELAQEWVEMKFCELKS